MQARAGVAILTCAFVDSDDFAEGEVAVGLDIIARLHAHFVGENDLVGDAAWKVVGTHGSP